MRGGFSFCGTDIADIGLYYAPELEDTYVYSPAKANIHDETFEGHNGGYYYGTYYEPKEFVLRCYFEEAHLDNGIMAKVHQLFRVGKSGKLIFQRRTWCYYHATVTEVTPDFHNFMNGLITIHMKAYYPYARSDMLYNYIMDTDHVRVMENTAMPEYEDFVPSNEVACPITEASSIYLFNPGTEPADVGIEIAGEGSVIIQNENNGNECLYHLYMNDENDYVYTDGINGKTLLYHDGRPEVNFLFHDHGFLKLEPAYPAIRNLYAQYGRNTKKVTTSNLLFDKFYRRETLDYANSVYAGRHIYLGGWYEIAEVQDENTLVLKDYPSGSGILRTMVVLMNKIIIKPYRSMNVTRLKFIYKATFA